MIYVPFRKDIYEVFDPAKNLIIDFFKKKGRKVEINPNDYGIDLIVDDKYYCEVQVKTFWSGPFFPRPELHIEPRKTKYLNLDKPTVFCVINKEKTHALFVTSDTVKKSRMEEVPNRRNPKGEYFYKVPVSQGKIVAIL